MTSVTLFPANRSHARCCDVWNNIGTSNITASPEASQLQTTVSDLFQRSYAPTTVPLYLRHRKNFKSFLSETNLPALWPSTPNHIALHEASLANSGRSLSFIRIALAAVAWFHKINNMLTHPKNRKYFFLKQSMHA